MSQPSEVFPGDPFKASRPGITRPSRGSDEKLGLLCGTEGGLVADTELLKKDSSHQSSTVIGLGRSSGTLTTQQPQVEAFHMFSAPASTCSTAILDTTTTAESLTTLLETCLLPSQGLGHVGHWNEGGSKPLQPTASQCTLQFNGPLAAEGNAGKSFPHANQQPLLQGRRNTPTDLNVSLFQSQCTANPSVSGCSESRLVFGASSNHHWFGHTSSTRAASASSMGGNVQWTSASGVVPDSTLSPLAMQKCAKRKFPGDERDPLHKNVIPRSAWARALVFGAERTEDKSVQVTAGISPRKRSELPDLASTKRKKPRSASPKSPETTPECGLHNSTRTVPTVAERAGNPFCSSTPKPDQA